MQCKKKSLHLTMDVKGEIVCRRRLLSRWCRYSLLKLVPGTYLCLTQRLFTFIYNYISYWRVFYQRVVWVSLQTPLFSHFLPSLCDSDFSNSRNFCSFSEKYKSCPKLASLTDILKDEINYLYFCDEFCLAVL